MASKSKCTILAVGVVVTWSADAVVFIDFINTCCPIGAWGAFAFIDF